MLNMSAGAANAGGPGNHGSQVGLMGSGQSPSSYPGQMGHPAVQQPSSPVFVSPPAKSQRLLHSEAYLRYIEGLTAESATISNAKTRCAPD
eukprot:XP_011612111.1 PREDICTED: protein polybromo-1-like isoform X2 [Takifugu rubripes]